MEQRKTEYNRISSCRSCGGKLVVTRTCHHCGETVVWYCASCFRCTIACSCSCGSLLGHGAGSGFASNIKLTFRSLASGIKRPLTTLTGNQMQAE